jgi:hypothetical protein
MSELYLYLLRTLALCVDSAASRTHPQALHQDIAQEG